MNTSEKKTLAELDKWGKAARKLKRKPYGNQSISQTSKGFQFLESKKVIASSEDSSGDYLEGFRINPVQFVAAWGGES